MPIETVGDVLAWTRSAHRQLAERLSRDARNAHPERVRLLMTYLADHEAALEQTLARLPEDVPPAALNTWCYDYFEEFAVAPPAAPDPAAFREGDTAQLLNDVLATHEALISLYRYLAERLTVPSAHELLTGLLELEEHEAMRLAQNAGRLESL